MTEGTQSYKGRIIWADDDSAGLLEPLVLFLQKEYQVESYVCYLDAMRRIEELSQEGKAEEVSVLADVILPHSAETPGALSSHLGLKLAERAIGLGVRTVVFLTVMLYPEVQVPYERLKKDAPEARLVFESKARLLEPNVIEGLIASLERSK